MSSDPNVQQQQLKQKEFMSLLPLIFELAGLPHSEIGRNYTPEQMEVRATTLRHAYKVARQLVIDVSK
ncbi:MAG: hypothetical protein ACJ8F7_13925 [Gemmataceae bacterium]